MLCYKFYVSKGRQFRELSISVFRTTTTTWTIKLQSQPASQIMNTSEVLIVFAELQAQSSCMAYLINFIKKIF